MVGCSVIQPVAVIGQHGDVLVGSATAAISGGTFEVTNSTITCRGTYNALLLTPDVNFSTVCNDGRQGIGTAIRDATGMGGRGTVSLDDGEIAQFIFGPEAGIFRPKTRPTP